MIEWDFAVRAGARRRLTLAMVTGSYAIEQAKQFEGGHKCTGSTVPLGPLIQ
jgi:hypothetical protein